MHAGVDELPANLDRLVRSDATADAEDDAGCGKGPVSAHRWILGPGVSSHRRRSPSLTVCA